MTMDNDRVMEKFGKALRRSDSETLFKLQVESSVSCSTCLMFDKINVENPVGSKERPYYVGLYRNSYPDSFLILYTDADKKYPKDFIWLKDCLVTSHKYVSEKSISLHCGGTTRTVAFRFDISETRVLWQQAIRDEIVFLEKQRRQSSRTSLNASDQEIDQIFSIGKQGCLRQTSSRKFLNPKQGLQNLFKISIDIKTQRTVSIV